MYWTCNVRWIILLILIDPQCISPIRAFGGGVGYSLTHVAELAQGGNHNYLTKYGIPMNLSQEMLTEFEWPTKGEECSIAKRALTSMGKRHKRNVEGSSEEGEEEEGQMEDNDSTMEVLLNLDGPMAKRNCSDEHHILANLLDGYDKFKIPGGGNLRVEVEIWVQEVSKIIEITSEFELDIYVTEWWLDSRLAFDHLNPCKKNMSVDGARVLPKIWNPLGCFVNSKSAEVHRSPFSNIFLQIYENGSVWHNYRIKLTGPCSNTFNRFPIDQQRCMLFYESFNHNYEQVQMEWTVSPIVLLKPNITLPDYVLVDFKASSVKRLYPPGVWNELVATFTFKRLYGFYILQVYIPTYISVCMSWISFYLGKENIPSRTIIGVNSLLSLTYQISSVVSNLPKTSDIKAIDVMILMAMGFIFSSLIELAVVGYLVSGKTSGNRKEHDCSKLFFCWQCPGLTANQIDKISLILFPLCFAVFNIWYWFIFMEMRIEIFS